jgi:hypothetical protein
MSKLFIRTENSSRVRHLPLFVFLEISEKMLRHRHFANRDPGLFCGLDSGPFIESSFKHLHPFSTNLFKTRAKLMT